MSLWSTAAGSQQSRILLTLLALATGLPAQLLDDAPERVRLLLAAPDAPDDVERRQLDAGERYLIGRARRQVVSVVLGPYRLPTDAPDAADVAVLDGAGGAARG